MPSICFGTSNMTWSHYYTCTWQMQNERWILVFHCVLNTSGSSLALSQKLHHIVQAQTLYQPILSSPYSWESRSWRCWMTWRQRRGTLTCATCLRRPSSLCSTTCSSGSGSASPASRPAHRAPPRAGFLEVRGVLSVSICSIPTMIVTHNPSKCFQLYQENSWS